MRFGSVFAGIGGFDLGLEQSGMECAWQVEKDKYATQVLERHWPNVTRYTDVTELVGDDLEPVDLMAGGFPCQNLSIAGKKEGIRGEQSGLFFDFMRLVRVVGPRYVLLENVPNLLTKPEWMGAVLGELAECGYDAEWRVLNSQHFGVPQNRERVFIVGYPRGTSIKPILFEQEGEEGGFEENEGSGRVHKRGHEGGAFSARGRSIVGTLTTGAEDVTGVHPRVIFVMEGDSWVARRMTPVECERAQGFPDNHTMGLATTRRWIVIGNAVTVPVAKWIGERIMESAHTSPRPQASPATAHSNS